MKRPVLLFVAALVTAAGMTSSAEAYRQRYYSWQPYQSRSYYYRYYYYKPTVSYSGYKYHYCIYYPKYPRYVYFYNPYSGYYWGRYDCQAKGYSLLKPADRRASLAKIPEKAFPKPGKMPPIPDSKDNVRIETPPNDLPKGEPGKDVTPVPPKNPKNPKKKQ